MTVESTYPSLLIDTDPFFVVTTNYKIKEKVPIYTKRTTVVDSKVTTVKHDVLQANRQ